VGELKQLLQDRGTDYRDCLEKRDLVARLEKAMKEGEAPSSSRNDGFYSALSPEEDRTIALFKKASPSVAYIRTTQLARESPFSMRALEVPQGTGSGFVWDSDGHVVTNYHVIENALRSRGGGIKVTLQNCAESFSAEVVGAEPDKDLAVLKLKLSRSDRDVLAPISVGSSSDLVVGQKVLAIGNPFGLDHTLTVGVVSALGREVSGAGGNTLRGCVQTDAAINPGNSGGPLLDSGGRLIGVNTAIVSASGSSAGIGFAIPVDAVRRVVAQLIRYGRVQRPSLGVQVAEDQIMAGIRARLGGGGGGGGRGGRGGQPLAEGVMVVELGPRARERGGPGNPLSGKPLQGLARRPDGSMALGDVIVSVNGSPVLKVEDLLCAIEEVEVGESVELMVRRRGTGLQAEPVRVRLFEPAGGGVSGGSSGALRGPQQRLGKDVRSSL
jgi:S1-C subfamily serine protease